MKFKFDLVEVGLCTVTLVVAAGYIADRVEPPFGSLFGSRSDSSSEAASATPLVASAPPVPGAIGTGQGPLPDIAELLSSLVDVPAPTLSGVASLGECGSDLSAAGLDAMLNGTPAGFSGSDYPHAYPLGEGRLLWLFQDVFHGGGDTLSEATFAHNDGFVQTGDCVRLLGAGQNAGQNGVRDPDESAGPPQSLVGGELERRRERWFWPLDGEIGADGDLWVFVAEMENPDGTGASDGALPVATWVAVFDAEDARPRVVRPSSRRLGGVVRLVDRLRRRVLVPVRPLLPTVRAAEQGGLLGPIRRVRRRSYLARVPRGEFDAAPEYSRRRGRIRRARSAAVPVPVPRRARERGERRTLRRHLRERHQARRLVRRRTGRVGRRGSRGSVGRRVDHAADDPLRPVQHLRHVPHAVDRGRPLVVAVSNNSFEMQRTRSPMRRSTDPR